MLAVILSDWFSKKQKALKNSSATERERERERMVCVWTCAVMCVLHWEGEQGICWHGSRSGIWLSRAEYLIMWPVSFNPFCRLIDVTLVWKMSSEVTVSVDFQYWRRLCDMEREVLASSVWRIWCSGYWRGYQVSWLECDELLHVECVLRGEGGGGGVICHVF